ncbi:hypothetical protein B0H14DRAFT_2594084 [Mycena olivaceomarginata]|nr:hypothetical protein B0H14DRAFT_2594084 [Mycena olivaceomarginata]
MLTQDTVAFRSGSPTGAQQRKREKTRFAPAPVCDGGSGSASGASVGSMSALPPSAGIQALTHIEVVEAFALKSTTVVDAYVPDELLEDAKEAGKSEPKKEKEEKERERKEERGKEPEEGKAGRTYSGDCPKCVPLPPQQQIFKDEQSSWYGGQTHGHGFAQLSMRPVSARFPPNGDHPPLVPRTRFPRTGSPPALAARQITAGMPCKLTPICPLHTTPRLHNPIPRRQRPRLLQTTCQVKAPVAPICAGSGIHTDCEVAAGDAFCRRRQCAEGPEGDGHDTDRGVFRRGGTTHISGSNNVAIGNRQPSASSIDEGRYPCLPRPWCLNMDFWIAGSAGEGRGPGSGTRMRRTRLGWFGMIAYLLMHYRDSYRPDNGPDTEAGRYGSPPPRFEREPAPHRRHPDSESHRQPHPLLSSLRKRHHPHGNTTICGTIGRNDTLGGLTMVQQMEPSLNAIGIRLPVNRLIAVTVHPVACPAAPGPIGRHRHRRRAIGVFSPLCTGGSIGTQTAATWPTQNCLVARADSY